MSVIKKALRYPFNLFGLQIVKLSNYFIEKRRISEILILGNSFYKEALQNRVEFLSDPEQLQFLEIKYGGYTTGVTPTTESNSGIPIIGTYHTGGNRMNVFYRNYSYKYSQYLSTLRHSKNEIILVEIGILKGTGLALWDEYFENKTIYGFDYDFGNFERNLSDLLRRGAFQDKIPTLKYYDQFEDNKERLKYIFGNSKIDIVIDDAYHSDKSIINTFNEFQPYLSNNFIYFIEDNSTAWRKLQKKYPRLNFDYNDNLLTVVTNK